MSAQKGIQKTLQRYHKVMNMGTLCTDEQTTGAQLKKSSLIKGETIAMITQDTKMQWSTFAIDKTIMGDMMMIAQDTKCNGLM